MEKQRQTQQQIEEERLMAKLWELDMKKKEAREKIEAEEKRKAIAERQAILDW